MNKPKIRIDDTNLPPLGVDEILVALYENGNSIYRAAEALDRKRSTIQAIIDREPTLKLYLDDHRETRVDKAEEIIDVAIEAKDLGIAKMVVVHQGKNRGWSTRTEQTGKDGSPLQVVIEGLDAQL